MQYLPVQSNQISVFKKNSAWTISLLIFVHILSIYLGWNHIKSIYDTKLAQFVRMLLLYRRTKIVTNYRGWSWTTIENGSFATQLMHGTCHHTLFTCYVMCMAHGPRHTQLCGAFWDTMKGNHTWKYNSQIDFEVPTLL